MAIKLPLFSLSSQQQKHLVHTYKSLLLCLSSPTYFFPFPLHSLDFVHLWARYINLHRKLIELNILHWQSISVPKHSFIHLFSFVFSLQQHSFTFINQSFTRFTVLSVRTGKYILLPLLVQAVSTTKAPCKMLHWKVMFHSEKSAF